MDALHFFKRSSSLWNMVFILTLMVYAAGLAVDIMEPDAAVYAEVSMEMHDSGDYFSIYHKHLDWLDKPPFPFWMSAISYSIFGVNNFGYKFPAVIFVLIGALYTFLFARKYYSPLHGWLAALLLLTTQHIIISNQDVRAEPFMTGLVIMGLYHFAAFVENKKGKGSSTVWVHAVAGSFALACLMMTKGLFTIIPVAAGIGLTLWYRKQWQAIFNWRWLVCLLLIAIFLSPALYGYYQQFDLHPEKLVFGTHHVSGVEFFLWTSQWGRFTNTGPIRGSGDPFFFVHTLLWAYLPWSFIAFYAVFRKTKLLFRRKDMGETFTYFGFVALFLVFSASKFQLSFYLNPLFPLLAIVSVSVLLDCPLKTLRIFSRIHFILCLLIVPAVCALQYFFLGHLPSVDGTAILLICFGISACLFLGRTAYLKRIVFGTALVFLGVNYYVNRDFYPALLNYQAESQAARFLKANHLPAEQLVFVGEVQSVADIILHHVTPVFAPDTVRADQVANKYVFTTPEGLKKLDSLQLPYETITTFADFPVTRLTGKFINRKTRASELQEKFLLKTGIRRETPGVVDVSTSALRHLLFPEPFGKPRTDPNRLDGGDTRTSEASRLAVIGGAYAR